MTRFALLSTIGLLALPSSLAARTWLVTPDGSGDAPTIQAGLDSTAVGDTVDVAPGTYFEHDIVLATGVVLKSTTGDPSVTIIDGLGQGRVLSAHSLDPSTVVEGFTVTGGGDTWGSGLSCEYSAPVVRNCVFRDNPTGSCVYLYEAELSDAADSPGRPGPARSLAVPAEPRVRADAGCGGVRGVLLRRSRTPPGQR